MTSSNPTSNEDRPTARLKQPEDLTLLYEVADATAGVSRLEMCIQCGTHEETRPLTPDKVYNPRTIPYPCPTQDEGGIL